MNVLLVWEENPESVKFYLINDASDRDIEMLEMANDKLINCEEMNEGMEYINDCLYDDDFSKDYSNSWKDKQVSTPINDSIDRVYYSGFVL